MFDLETRLAEWRTLMSEALPQRPEALSELEEHLREHFTHLQRQGIPDDEAFARARERIGEPQAVAREFTRMPRGYRPGLIVLPLLALCQAFHIGHTFWRWPQHSPVTAFPVIWLTTSATGYFAVFGATFIAIGAFLRTAWRPLSERERLAVRRMLTKLVWIALVALTAGWAFFALWGQVSGPYHMRMVGLLVSLGLVILLQSRSGISDRVRWCAAASPLLVLLVINVGRFYRVGGVSVAWLAVVFILAQVFFALPRFRIRIERLRASS